MPKKDNIPQDEKAVDDVLDDAGQKLKAFMRKNAADLRELTSNYAALKESSAVKESTHTALLAFLTKQYTDLGVALGLHTPIATASNDGEQVSPAAVEEALAATEVAKQNELEWKTMVDQTLADHEGRITALEGKDKVPTLASVPAAEPMPAPTPEVKQSEEKTPAVAVVEQKPVERPVTGFRYVHPKTWGGMAWVMAAFGFIVLALIALAIQGYFFPGVPDPMQYVRWGTLLMFPVFGLFAGGALGASYDESKQPEETTVA